MSSNFPELSVLKRVKFFNLFKEGSDGAIKMFLAFGTFCFTQNFIRYVLKKKLLELKITSRGSQLRGSVLC